MAQISSIAAGIGIIIGRISLGFLHPAFAVDIIVDNSSFAHPWIAVGPRLIPLQNLVGWIIILRSSFFLKIIYIHYKDYS